MNGSYFIGIAIMYKFVTILSWLTKYDMSSFQTTMSHKMFSL